VTREPALGFRLIIVDLMIGDPTAFPLIQTPFQPGDDEKT
jgi:hypothetical protein